LGGRGKIISDSRPAWATKQILAKSERGAGGEEEKEEEEEEEETCILKILQTA
jgi:hypothetical protein